MSKKLAVAALGAMVAVGIGSQAIGENTSNDKQKPEQKKLAQGFQKCYGIAKAGMHDGANGAVSNDDNAKNAWIGVPKGTCNKIVGGSTEGA